METPKRMRLAETLAQISEYLTVRCRREGNEIICARCGGEIRRVRAFMSLHDEQFGDQCMGPGRAWRLEIPFCVACEDPPGQYGCIDMSDTDLNLPTVIEASRPFGKDQTEVQR